MSSEQEIELALTSADAEVRRHGVEKLATEALKGRAPLLVKCMADSDWRVRKEAVRIAKALSPAPDVMSSLLATFTDSDHVGQRNAAVEALAVYGESVVDELGRRLGAFDADAKKLAAEVLGSSGEARAFLPLSQLLVDVDPNVQMAGIEAVAALGAVDPEEAFHLLEAALRSSHAMLRLAALGGLNTLQLALPVPHIASMLSDPILRPTALLALGLTGDVVAVPMLVDELNRGPGAAFREALIALATLGKSGENLQRAVEAALSKAPRATELVEAQAASRGEDLVWCKSAVFLCGLQKTPRSAEILVSRLGDADMEAEAEAALASLRELGVLALVRVIPEADVEEAFGLLEILARLPRNGSLAEVDAVLLRLLSEGDSRQARWVLTAAARHGGEAMISALLPWLRQEVPPSVRKVAVQAFGELTSNFPESARRAVLSADPQSLAWPIVVATLGKPVHTEPDVDIAHLKQLLATDDKTMRRLAVEALAALAEPSAVEVLALALTDEEPEVQVAALGALGSLRAENGSSPGALPLISLIAQTEEDRLLIPAIRALGNTNDSRALEVLRSMLSRPEPLCALTAIEALVGLKSPFRSEALADALEHSAPDVVKLALEALVVEFGSQAAPHVRFCLEHPLREVRDFAAHLAAAVPGMDPDVIRLRLRSEPDSQVHAALLRTLNQLEGRPSSRAPRLSPPPTDPSRA